ncbi:MAG TPA: phage tail tip lysozyme [Polyangiaceae bacterium]
MNQRALGLLAPLFVASLSAATAGCGGSPGEDVGSTDSASTVNANEKTAYQFFLGKGLKSYQAAGIVGNLMQESDVNPSISQYGGGPGRGIAQWSAGGRWDSDHDDNVAWYAAKEGQSRYSLTLQLEFVWYELTTFSGYGLGTLRGSTNVTQATVAFQNDFEGCGQCDESTRIAYAEAVLSAEGGSGGGGGGGGGAKGCYSDTKGKEMPANACVQSKYDSAWYQCDNGSWVDRWTDPAACDGVYPL